jgi:hypothetical protein
MLASDHCCGSDHAASSDLTKAASFLPVASARLTFRLGREKRQLPRRNSAVKSISIRPNLLYAMRVDIERQEENQL